MSRFFKKKLVKFSSLSLPDPCYWGTLRDLAIRNGGPNENDKPALSKNSTPGSPIRRLRGDGRLKRREKSPFLKYPGTCGQCDLHLSC